MVLRAMVGLPGVTATETMAAAVTVSTVEDDLPPYDAEIRSKDQPLDRRRALCFRPRHRPSRCWCRKKPKSPDP